MAAHGALVSLCGALERGVEGRVWAGQVSSFGSLPRSMSTAVLADGSPDGHRAPEAYMSKVESIASTAVRAATKMDVSISAPASCCCAYLVHALRMRGPAVLLWSKRILGSCCEARLLRQAGLIICYAGTGRTASLIAKYRPTVPILALVVPHLKSKGLSWELEGRFLARQFQVMRGAPR